MPIVYIKSLSKENTRLDENYQVLKTLCTKLVEKWHIKLRVKISEKIDAKETYYLVSNHQGTLDPIFIIASSPIAHSFISKEENLKIPIIGAWGRKIEFITFNRNAFEENVSMLRQAMRFLKEKKSLLVFPEGTRSKNQAMLDFKVGAFLPAYGAKVKILPVTLNNAYKLDEYNSNVQEISIIYHDPIEFSDYADLTYEACAAKVKIIIESALES